MQKNSFRAKEHQIQITFWSYSKISWKEYNPMWAIKWNGLFMSKNRSYIAGVSSFWVVISAAGLRLIKLKSPKTEFMGKSRGFHKWVSQKGQWKILNQKIMCGKHFWKNILVRMAHFSTLCHVPLTSLPLTSPPAIAFFFVLFFCFLFSCFKAQRSL